MPTENVSLKHVVAGTTVCATVWFPGRNPQYVSLSQRSKDKYTPFSINEAVSNSGVYDASSRTSLLNMAQSSEGQKLSDNLNKLNAFSGFTSNWNGYGADPFSSKVISSVTEIIKKLIIQPQIFPVADDSIQLEYDGKNGRYLEFQIYGNEARYYFDDGNGNDLEGMIEPSADSINKIVEDFYGQSL